MKLFKNIVVSLLIAGLFAIAEHHHDDFDEHDDCPICALVQHGLDHTDDTPRITVFWVTLFVLAETACVRHTVFQCNFYKPRGPPQLSA